MPKLRGRGRPKKFKLGDIATYKGDLVVIVDYRRTGSKAEYRVVNLTPWHTRRYGRPVWRETTKLEPTDIQRAGARGSVMTYRANKNLEDELDGRGCNCECCIHYALPRSEFKRRTGEWKGEDDEQ